MHLNNDRSAGNGAYERKGTTSRVMLASRPIVSFWTDGGISPGNYGYHLVIFFIIIIIIIIISLDRVHVVLHPILSTRDDGRVWSSWRMKIGKENLLQSHTISARVELRPQRRKAGDWPPELQHDPLTDSVRVPAVVSSVVWSRAVRLKSTDDSEEHFVCILRVGE
jgi:hypothetical protein